MTTEINLWQGKFGNKYLERNPITDAVLAARINMWLFILNIIENLGNFKFDKLYDNISVDILEVGCGNGVNLIALSNILKTTGATNTRLWGIDVNRNSIEEAIKNYKDYGQDQTNVSFVNNNIFNYPTINNSMDIIFTSGVLIHIHPDELVKTMKEIYSKSKRYIVCIEYFSPEPREINYHNKNALWSCDFGSMWLDNFPLRCLGTAFFWKRTTGLDNLTCWIFEKVN